MCFYVIEECEDYKSEHIALNNSVEDKIIKEAFAEKSLPFGVWE